MKFTVFGGRGFIGRHLVQYLRERHEEVCVPQRDANTPTSLGNVIYAIGLTGDFRIRPFETVDAHVSAMIKRMEGCRFDSWLYLSSTRVYSGLDESSVASEDTPIPVLPSADSLYDLSKLLGESVCLAQHSNAVRAARLSNVYGFDQSAHTFLGAILGSLKRQRAVVIHESPDSGKDYISVSALGPILEAIALHGTYRIYNVASSHTVTHAELAHELSSLTAVPVAFEPSAPRRRFPDIDISLIAKEFAFRPTNLLSDLRELLAASGIL